MLVDNAQDNVVNINMLRDTVSFFFWNISTPDVILFFIEFYISKLGAKWLNSRDKCHTHDADAGGGVNVEKYVGYIYLLYCQLWLR